MMTQQQSPKNVNWTNYLYSTCDDASLNNIIFPYGPLEILLLKTLPPTDKREICQILPDVTNPRRSYAELEAKIIDLTTKSMPLFWTWNYPAIQYHNDSLTNHHHHKNLNKLYIKNNNLSKKNSKLFQKLQKTRMIRHFDQFRLELLKHTLHNLDGELVKNNISKSINKTLQQKNAHTQVIETFATKLWQIHLRRQVILHKTYAQLHLHKFITSAKHDKRFKPNEIYENQLKGNTVYSRSRLKITDRPFTVSNSLPINTPLVHPFLNKLINLFNHVINTSVQLIYHARKYFSTSQYTINDPLLTQISLNKINV